MRLPHRSLAQLTLLLFSTLSFFPGIGATSTGIENESKEGVRRTKTIDEIEGFTPEQSSELKKSILNKILQGANGDQDQQAGGNWDFLNDFLSTIPIGFSFDSNFEVSGFSIYIGEVTCQNLAFGDITAKATTSLTAVDLSFLIEGISLSCVMDYEFDGGTFLGIKSGDLELVFGSASSVQATITFESSNFETDEPLAVSMSCLADIKVETLDFNDSLLNLAASVAIETIEPELNALVCLQVEALELLLAQGVSVLNSVLELIDQPLPPEMTDPLYQEKQMAPILEKSTLTFVDFAPVLDEFKVIIEGLVRSIELILIGDDDVVTIPFPFPISEGISLVEVRYTGLESSLVSNLSLLGNYTLYTAFESSKEIGIELDVAIARGDGTDMVDIYEIKTGIDDVSFDIAFLTIFEDLGDVPALANLDCMINSSFALRFSLLSMTSAKFSPVTVSGLSELEGPSEVISEVSKAIIFMYDNLLVKATTFLFETEVKEYANLALEMLLPSCMEKLMGKTVYIPSPKACYKAELFEGGVLAADKSDPDCSNEVHRSKESISAFDSVTGSSANFKGGDIGWSGKIDFMDDFKISKTMLKDKKSRRKKKFQAQVTMPSCALPCI